MLIHKIISILYLIVQNILTTNILSLLFSHKFDLLIILLVYSVNIKIIQNKLYREKSALQKKVIYFNLKNINTQHTTTDKTTNI